MMFLDKNGVYHFSENKEEKEILINEVSETELINILSNTNKILNQKDLKNEELKSYLLKKWDFIRHNYDNISESDYKHFEEIMKN